MKTFLPKLSLLILFVSSMAFLAGAQEKVKIDYPKFDTSKKDNQLTISIEFRPRTEFRRGYKSLPPVTDTTPAFFTQQRARLNFGYNSKKLDFYASLQSVYTWGQNDPRAYNGPVNGYFQVFEFWAEPRFNNKWSTRIGRQRIAYDNQRLFAENDWRVGGNAFDAVRLIYDNKIDFTNELTWSYSQSADNTFGTNYKPSGFTNYKNLIVDYLNWKVSNKVNFLSINTADGYQSSNPAKYKTTYTRFTTGGRLEYATYNWYFTLSGYYQFGKDSSGKDLSAYYFQPEVKYTGIKNLSIRYGFEYFSGQDATKPATKDNSFVPLYGVAHRFNGNIDLFTVFPGDFNNAGLNDQYLYFQYTKNKISIREENHLFYSSANFLTKTGELLDKYLGYEQDWRLNYKPSNMIDLEVGFCWVAPTEALGVIKKGSGTKTPYWSYVSVRFTPTLGKFSF